MRDLLVHHTDRTAATAQGEEDEQAGNATTATRDQER
jgi:hypothetical protein